MTDLVWDNISTLITKVPFHIVATNNNRVIIVVIKNKLTCVGGTPLEYLSQGEISVVR